MLNLENRRHFLLEEAGEPSTTSTTVVDENAPPTDTPANTPTTAKLSDLVSDENAKAFLEKSTYDANAIVKMAMEGQKATTPAANFTIGDISDRLSKEHKMEAEDIRSFLNDEPFITEVLGQVKNIKASQAVADNLLVETIADLHSTEKGTAEKIKNAIVKNFGTEEAYDTTVNKMNTAQEVIPKANRLDPKALNPETLKAFMLLLDGKAFNTDALPGKSIIEKAANGFAGRDGQTYAVNGDADYATLANQLNQIPASDKRNNPVWDKFLNDIVAYRAKNGLDNDGKG